MKSSKFGCRLRLRFQHATEPKHRITDVYTYYRPVYRVGVVVAVTPHSSPSNERAQPQPTSSTSQAHNTASNPPRTQPRTSDITLQSPNPKPNTRRRRRRRRGLAVSGEERRAGAGHRPQWRAERQVDSSARDQRQGTPEPRRPPHRPSAPSATTTAATTELSSNVSVCSSILISSVRVDLLLFYLSIHSYQLVH